MFDSFVQNSFNFWQWPFHFSRPLGLRAEFCSEFWSESSSLPHPVFMLSIVVTWYILIDVKFLSTSVVVTGVELSDSSQGSSEHLVVYFTYLGIYWVVFNFCPKQAHGPTMASILFIPNVFPLIVCVNIILMTLFFPGKDN